MRQEAAKERSTEAGKNASAAVLSADRVPRKNRQQIRLSFRISRGALRGDNAEIGFYMGRDCAAAAAASSRARRRFEKPSH